MALGTDPDVDVDAFTYDARPGDLFLLCSDGLTTMVDAGGIAALVGRHRNDLAAATRALIDAANDRGGDDNITAVLFDIADGPAGDGAAAAGAVDPDEADTLHPEDRVPAIVDAAAPAAAATVLEPPVEPARVEGDTRILSPEAIRAALAGGTAAAAETAAPETEPEPAPERPTDPEAEAGTETEPAFGPGADPDAEAEAEPEEEKIHVPLWRKLLAFLIIVVLAAAVVLLVTQGLAR